MQKAHNDGYQLTVHAIGPRGIEPILQAFEAVIKTDSENPGKNRLRHRIDHFEFPTAEQVRRANEIGLLFTAQPGYSWMDEHFQRAYHQYLTREQFESQIPLETIAEAGGIICGSSDSPVQDISPFIQLQGMTDFPIKGERLSAYEAFRTYTYNGAYSTFEEDERAHCSRVPWLILLSWTGILSTFHPID